MKKNIIVPIVILIVVIGAVFVGLSLKKDNQVKGNKISVVTTLFPLYDFAKEIGGDKVEVSLLLPPGVEAHAFEPKPSDIIKINESDLFVYTGKFMEPWAEDIIKGIINKNVKVVDSSVGIELMKEESHEEESSEHAFEWAGSFNLKKGNYVWSFAKVDGSYADPEMKMAVIHSSTRGANAIESVEASIESAFKGELMSVKDGEIISPNQKAYKLSFNQAKDKSNFTIHIESDGNYVFFTEHMPTEFEGNEHFFKDIALNDIEPEATEPASGSHDHHHHGGVDPHIWLGFNNSQIMVSNIAKVLAEKDPANADFYNTNASLYIKKLSALDESYKNTLSICKTREVVYGGHYAFGYLAKRYNLGYVSAQGFSPDSEPTAKDMIALVDQIKKNNINYVFYEELASPKIAETLSKETGAKLLLLNGAHNLSKEEMENNVSFLSIMEKNLVNLKTGLSCGK